MMTIADSTRLARMEKERVTPLLDADRADDPVPGKRKRAIF